MIEYTVKVFENGDKLWYLNGKLHREDGPAIEHVDGRKSWYLNGVQYTEKEFNAKMNPVKWYTIKELEALLGHTVKIVKE